MSFFLTALATALLVGIARAAWLGGRAPARTRLRAAAPAACLPGHPERRAA